METQAPSAHHCKDYNWHTPLKRTVLPGAVPSGHNADRQRGFWDQLPHTACFQGYDAIRKEIIKIMTHSHILFTARWHHVRLKTFCINLLVLLHGLLAPCSNKRYF